MYGVGGAASRPMAWAGGGSTKPPMVNNYLDSHGLNAGLGNSAHTQFPSVVDTKPMQVDSFIFILPNTDFIKLISKRNF